MKNEKDKLNTVSEDGSQDRSTYGGSRYRWQYDEYKKELEQKEKKSEKHASELMGITVLIVFVVAVLAVVFLFVTDAMLKTKGMSLSALLPWHSETVAPSETETEETEGIAKEEIDRIAMETAVHITVTAEDGSVGTAAGVLISGDGYLITAAHAVENASSFKVVTHAGKTYDAEIKGIDESVDVALLKVEGQGLSTVKFGISAKIMEGEEITFIRTSEGEHGCSTERLSVKQIAGGVMYFASEVTHGNCGAPVLDGKGRLVGIVSAEFANGDMAAVCVDTFLPILSGMMIPGNDKNDEVYVIEALGMSVKTVTDDQADKFKLPKGCLVYFVEGGSRAEALGLTKGDIIVSINGERISDPESMLSLIEEAGCRIEINRKGQILVIQE